MADNVRFIFTVHRPPRPTLFPYTTLFRSCPGRPQAQHGATVDADAGLRCLSRPARGGRLAGWRPGARSEEHTSELQSRPHLVCRLLLEKKNSLLLVHYLRATPGLPGTHLG